MNEKLSMRMPSTLKRKIRAEAKSRMLAPADIVREALLNHFTKQEKKEQVVA